MRLLRATPVLDEEGLERALAHLQDVVRSRGLKRSAVRDTIARVALQQQGHFDAEDLVNVLKAQDVPGAHVATVYRVLPLLVDAGLLQPALISTGERHRFERAFEREHHDHLVCTRCGTVVEFYFEAFEVLQRDVAERFGFDLTGHVHELLGVCRDCRAAENP